MTRKPQVLLFTPSRQLADEVAQLLHETASVWNARETATVATERAVAALVDLGERADALRVLGELAAAAPQLPLVGLAPEKDPDLILQAMRAGMREFVLYGESAELARVVSVFAQAERAAPAGDRGSIVSVFGAKGGLGATSIATNLAGELRSAGHSVVLVDLDVQLGDVLTFLDMDAKLTLADLMTNLARADRELLMSSIAQHASGVCVLSQASQIDQADKVSPTQVGTLLRFLATQFDYVLCDGFGGFDEMSLSALDVSDRILLISSQDVPSIKNTRRCLELFRRLGYHDGRIELVINRYSRGDRIDLDAIAETVCARISHTISNDYSSLIRAIHAGRLLGETAPRARVTAEVRRLATLVAGGELAEKAPAPSGFLRNLFGRNGKPASEPKKENSDEPESAPQAV
jgi:pilus assembly protein CpaE